MRRHVYCDLIPFLRNNFREKILYCNSSIYIWRPGPSRAPATKYQAWFLLPVGAAAGDAWQ